MFRTSQFDKLLDKATSNLRLDPDWPAILQICDLIRQNDVTPKHAVAAVKKKLYSQNPHQAMFALLTLESLVKNCGSGVHDEVASKPFCESLRDLVKTTPHENVKTKVLELAQAWAFAFRNTPKYRAVQDIVNILKAEGYKFPALKESDAMFSADTAPEWADGEVCHRCRVAFSLMVRQHHCRACGQVFCQQCSSKTSTLPKFGIEKEVRVCDACHDRLNRPSSNTSKIETVASDYPTTANPTAKPPGKTAEELQEEEELQLALALSQSEAEHKEKERRSGGRPVTAAEPPAASLRPNLSPTPSSVSASPEHNTAANSELNRYLDRNYWEMRLNRDSANAAAPTAPTPSSTPLSSEAEYAKPVKNKHVQDDDAEDKEIDEFVDTLKSQIEVFVNRMKSNSSRGRSIANDTSVQTLFMNITAMHSRLLRYIQQLDDKRVYLESLQDKVTQVRDARAALDTLRAEHAAQLAAAQEAADRQKQMQMAAKLQAMRRKKHDYLQYQRQLALQRVQEQEREMQMRQEQQKHQYMAAASGNFLPSFMTSVNQQFQQYPQPIYASNQYPMMMQQPPTTDPMAAKTQPNMIPINQLPHHLNNAYAVPTTGMAINPAQINQGNIRPLTQQQQMLPMQQQMLMQQMQMRMQMPGAQMIRPPNIANGQNITQTDPNQLNKQPNPASNMVPMSTAPTSMPQVINGQMTMPGMRMPMMQGNVPYNPNVMMSLPNQHTDVQQQIPGQMVQGRPISGQNQGINLPNHIPTTSQGQTTQLPGQPIQGQVPNQMIGQINQQIAQNQMPQAPSIAGQPQISMQTAMQHMPQQGQIPVQATQQFQHSHMQGQIPQNMQTMPQTNHNQVSQGQQMPQIQQTTQGQQAPQNQQLPQGPQTSQPSQVTQQQAALPRNTNQIPQMGQAQQIPQGQQMQQGQQISQVQMPQAQQLGQQIPQGQQMALGQQMPQGQQIQQGQQMLQGQQIPQGQQVPQGQQIPQGQQTSQGQQITQNHQMPQLHQPQQIPQQIAQGHLPQTGPQGQQISQQMHPNQQMPQGQPMPLNIHGQIKFEPQQNFGMHQQQQNQPLKAESNNNTSELIKFD